jgi:hypothetical protein
METLAHNEEPFSLNDVVNSILTTPVDKNQLGSPDVGYCFMLLDNVAEKTRFWRL